MTGLFSGLMSRLTRRCLIVLAALDLVFLTYLWLDGLHHLFAFPRPIFYRLPRDYFVVGGWVPESAIQAFVLLLVALPVLILLRLYRATAGIAFRQPAELDERQRHQRDNSMRISYLIVLRSAILGFGLLLLSVLFGLGRSWPIFGGSRFIITPGPPLLSPVLSLVVISGLVTAFIALLPTLVIAWLEPDPVEEEILNQKSVGNKSGAV